MVLFKVLRAELTEIFAISVANTGQNLHRTTVNCHYRGKAQVNRLGYYTNNYWPS